MVTTEIPSNHVFYNNNFFIAFVIDNETKSNRWENVYYPNRATITAIKTWM